MRFYLSSLKKSSIELRLNLLQIHFLIVKVSHKFDQSFINRKKDTLIIVTHLKTLYSCKITWHNGTNLCPTFLLLTMYCIELIEKVWISIKISVDLFGRTIKKKGTGIPRGNGCKLTKNDQFEAEGKRLSDILRSSKAQRYC